MFAAGRTPQRPDYKVSREERKGGDFKKEDFHAPGGKSPKTRKRKNLKIFKKIPILFEFLLAFP